MIKVSNWVVSTDKSDYWLTGYFSDSQLQNGENDSIKMDSKR